MKLSSETKLKNKSYHKISCLKKRVLEKMETIINFGNIYRISLNSHTFEKITILKTNYANMMTILTFLRKLCHYVNEHELRNYMGFYPSIRCYNSILNYFIFVFICICLNK